MANESRNFCGIFCLCTRKHEQAESESRLVTCAHTSNHDTTSSGSSGRSSRKFVNSATEIRRFAELLATPNRYSVTSARDCSTQIDTAWLPLIGPRAPSHHIRRRFSLTLLQIHHHHHYPLSRQSSSARRRRRQPSQLLVRLSTRQRSQSVSHRSRKSYTPGLSSSRCLSIVIKFTRENQLQLLLRFGREENWNTFVGFWSGGELEHDPSPLTDDDVMDRDVEAQWYEALFEEDCLRVMRLLRGNPTLLKVGWGGEPSREVRGSRRLNHVESRTRSPWRGRTALHVGARRGCAELIQQVLLLCNSGYSGAAVIGSGSSSEGDDKSSAESSASVNCSSGGGKVTPLGQLGQYPAAVGDQSRTHRGKQRGIARWKRRLLGKGKGNEGAEHAVSDSSTNSQPRQIAEIDDEDGDLASNYEYNSTASPAAANSVVPLSSDDLSDLLLAKDGEYKLDALAMAVLHGNLDVIVPLVSAFGACGTNPYRIEIERSCLRNYNWNGDADDNDVDRRPPHRARLRQATEEVMASIAAHVPGFRTSFLEKYSRALNFNFLPPEEFLFRFSFTSEFRCAVRVRAWVREALWAKVRSFPDELWRFVLKLRDGQGRPPLDVAVDEDTAAEFFDTICSKMTDTGDTATTGDGGAAEVVNCAVTARDGAGRTALLRAAAKNRPAVVSLLTALMGGGESGYLGVRGSQSGVGFMEPPPPAGCSGEWTHSVVEVMRSRGVSSFDVDCLSLANGFGGVNVPSGCSPLRAAIIHGNDECVRAILGEGGEWREPDLSHVSNSWIVIPGGRRVHLDAMGLACFVANVTAVRMLLEDGYHGDGCLLEESSRPQGKNAMKPSMPTLHLVATYGDYAILKSFLDSPRCDPFIEDFDGNIALHRVLEEPRVVFETPLLEYVDCDHILSNDQRKRTKVQFDFLLERVGCVTLLLQAGCDIFQANKYKQVPQPQGSLGSNAKFLLWWYDKQAKEFATIQNNLKTAANAILVTATLVATASYVGPLQPPLGYVGDPNHIQYENIWVRIFIFCDTLSFHLAITAITFSLIPSLPLPQQAMIDELNRTRGMVTLAVAVLFPSIVCVLVAFISSSLAVINANLATSTGGHLTIAATAIGGPLFLGGFVLFFIRLLGIWFPRNSWIRYIDKRVSF